MRRGGGAALAGKGRSMGFWDSKDRCIQQVFTEYFLGVGYIAVNKIDKNFLAS